MMKKIALSRPATSAIAAFLALSTPAAFAQEAPTVPMTSPVAVSPPSAPPTVAEPAPAPPTAAPQTATTPQPVIRVPLDVTPEPAAPAPEATPRAEAATPARAQRAAPRVRAAEPAPTPVAAPAATAAVAETILPEEVAPIATPIEPIAEAVPPAEMAAPAGNGFPWEIAGGAAALLLVGGAGLAFARRRRASSEVWDFRDADPDAEWVPPADAEPAIATPVAREDAVIAAPQSEPAFRSTPTFAAAPHGSMGRHEAIAMTGPTPDNPFETLNKRLARARFLDRQERVAYEETLASQKDMTRKPASAWEIAQRPAPAAEQEVRRPERSTARTASLKPGWMRN